MAAKRSDSNLSQICTHPISRQLVNNPSGLTSAQTWVLRAACDEAIRLGTHRMTLDQVAARLWSWMPDPVQAVDQAIEPLTKRGYLVADDQPELAETILHVTREGFEAYATRYIEGYAERSSRVLTWLAINGAGYNAVDIAHACGVIEFLVLHILDMAEASALIRLNRQPHYVVVAEVLAGWRRQLTGQHRL